MWRALTAALGIAVLAGSSSAQAQDISNPPVPYVNNGTINSVSFTDRLTHDAGGVAAVTNNGQINANGSANTVAANGISIVFRTSLLGSVVNAGTGTINALTEHGITLGSPLIPEAPFFIHDLANVTGDIRNDGTISVHGASAAGIRVFDAGTTAGSGGTGSIINNGSITSDKFAGILIQGGQIAGGILNAGTIQAHSSGIRVVGLNFADRINSTSSVGGGILNTGTITVSDGAPGTSAILVSSFQITGGIRNDGQLLAPNGGAGITLAGPAIQCCNSVLTGDVVNNGTIAVGGTGVGINLTSQSQSNGLFLNAGGGGTGSVINNGTISATTGIAVGLTNFVVGGGPNVRIAGAIVNNGTIDSTTAIDLATSGLIQLSNAPRPGITVNQNAGVMNGAVLLSPDSPDVFNIAGGAVNGAVSGGAASQLNVTGGTLVGDVSGLGLFAVNRPDTFTYGNAFSGPGAFQQNGAGTTILTGANTYTGGTTISAGTLQLGNGGATGSIVGNVINNGNLVFNRSDAITFGGAISGTGAVQHNGSGSTNLAGASTYTGPTTINAGTLAVNGSITSAVAVNSGATLAGSGTVGSTTVNSGGNLSPGNSIGTININGNLVLGAGSVYTVEISPANADRTNVSGTATLNGTLNAIFGPGAYSTNSYTVLSATGGSSGTFSNFTTSGLPPFLSASLTYTATDVLLVTLLSKIGVVPGLTFNERAVAVAQDTAFNAGKPGVAALYNLTLAQLPGALDQLSGEVHPSTAGVLMDESVYARSAVLGRLRQASYGSDSSMASLALGGPMAFANGEDLNSPLAYAKSPVVTKAPAMASQPGYDVVFWAQGLGARGKFDSDGNTASVRRDLAGFFSGVDTRVGANGRLGIAAGYTASRNNLDGRGGSNVETGHFSGYGGWSLGTLNLRAGGTYAWHTVDTTRNVVFPGFFDTATAHYNGGTGQIFGEAGYGFAFGGVAVEPFAGGAYVHLKTDAAVERGGAAVERGGAAALNLAANSFEVGYSSLGIRAASMIPIGSDMILVPRGSVAWQHAFNDVTPLATLAFQSSGVPFVTAGVPIARDSVLGEAGLDLNIGRNATLGVSYVGQAARTVHDHAAKGKFSWRF